MNQKFILIIQKVTNTIIENKDYLTELDRVIGDGDHGINLTRGFEKVLEQLDSFSEMNPSEIMIKIAMTLISNVGGASGAIYGSAFLRAGQFLKDKTIDNQTIVQTWEEMIKAIETRGGAKIGDKTMLDTIVPAYQAFKSTINSNKDLKTAFIEASKAAEIGMDNTKNMIASKGRATYLGERSKNHIDPGSCSSYLMIKTISELI